MSIPKDFSRTAYNPPKQAASTPATGGRKTPEGLTLKTSYGPDDTAALDHLSGLPGQPPYIRGPYPSMYVTKPWTIRQYAGFSTASESNAFYRRNLAAGQKGL